MPAETAPGPTGVIQALSIGPLLDGEGPLRHVFEQCNWLLHGVSTCQEAVAYLSNHDTVVAICERDLPDGDWKLVLDSFDSMPTPPKLIVTSRLADEELWADVLHRGGYDVLAQPFDAQEIYRAVLSAWYAKKAQGYGAGETHE